MLELVYASAYAPIAAFADPSLPEHSALITYDQLRCVLLKAEFTDASTCARSRRRVGVSVLRDFTNSRRTR
jgi:hypothetical protein